MDGGSKVVKKFKYPEVVYNHYQFRDVIDNNNSMRMSLISMEETWMTSQWANRVFCFLLAVMVVNIQNAGCYFLNLMKVDALKAHKLIAEQLIHNKYLRKPDEKCMSQRKNTNADCHLIALPPHKKFKQSKEVFDNTKYNHWKCTCGDAHVRTYCQCTPGTFYCVNIMQRTALRRIDAITKRSRIQLFFKKHPICRTVQLCRISITCVSCYIYKCRTEKGLFKICLDHFSVGQFVHKK